MSSLYPIYAPYFQPLLSVWRSAETVCLLSYMFGEECCQLCKSVDEAAVALINYCSCNCLQPYILKSGRRDVIQKGSRSKQLGSVKFSTGKMQKLGKQTSEKPWQNCLITEKNWGSVSFLQMFGSMFFFFFTCYLT